MFLLRFFLMTKFGLILTLLITLSGSFYGWLYMHDKSVTEAATNAYNTMQQQIYQKKQEEFVQKTEVINDNAARIREAIAKHEQDMNDISNGIEKQAITEHKGTEQASKYLKNIIYQLDQNYGAKK
jgi:uncharacterized protein YozE (UPF0346 family)